MLKAAACLWVGAVACLGYFLCNDPRFDPGSTIMCSVVERDDLHGNRIMVEAEACYFANIGIPISFSGLTGMAAIRVLPESLVIQDTMALCQP